MCQTEGEGCLEQTTPTSRAGARRAPSTQGLTAQTAEGKSVCGLHGTSGATAADTKALGRGRRRVRRLRWTHCCQGGDSGGGTGKIRAGLGESREAG